MAVDGGAGVHFLELVDEFTEGVALCIGAGVLGCLAIGGETADVADADGAGVVAGCVGTYLVDVASGEDTTVTVDDVVVADGGIAAILVPAGDVGYGVVFALGCGRAMDDDAGDGAVGFNESELGLLGVVTGVIGWGKFQDLLPGLGAYYAVVLQAFGTLEGADDLFGDGAEYAVFGEI